MDEDYREVKFDAYCKNCKYCEVPEIEEPCNECLEQSVNLHTYKPNNFNEIEKRGK